MKKTLLLLLGLTSINLGYSQSYCSDNQGVIIPDLTPQTLSSTGGYYELNVTTGCTYVFSHCQNGGSYTGDPYLRITDASNVPYTSNDDNCGLGSEITWTSTVTGVVRIHLGTCCGGTGGSPIMCSGGPSRVLAYWSTNCAACSGTTTPTVSPVTAICGSGTFTLNASSPDPLDWFDTPNTAGTPVGSGSTFTTPTLTATTSYWVAPYSTANGCYGTPVEVICEVDQLDNITFSNTNTFLCILGDSVVINPSVSGGVFSGSGATVTGFDPSVGSGTHWVYYDLNDACGSNDSIMFIVQSPLQDLSVGGCPGDSLTLVSSGGPGINWFNDVYGSVMLDTGDTYTFLMDTAVSYFYAQGSGLGEFWIDTLTNNNATVLDHNTPTGDDRGGVAITPDYFYVMGDGSGARIDADFTGSWTAVPRRDGIISDLETGMLYTLWDGSTDPTGTSVSGYNFTHLAPMDNALTIDNVNTIALSQIITVGGHCVMAAGKNFMILWNNTDMTFYKITYVSGMVEVLGTGTPNYYYSENWADWGVAEVLPGGEYGISYRAGGSTIERFNIDQGTTEAVADYSAVGGISDLSSFTVSPWNNRMYFHHEYSSGAFGGSSETGGFADATLVTAPGYQGCPVEVPVTVNPLPSVDLGGDSTICENEPITLDAGAGLTSYAWSTGETTQTITTNVDGDVSVEITNSFGCTDQDTITLTILPIIDVNLGPDFNVCTVQLFTLNAGGGYDTYSWSTGESTSLISVNAGSLPLGDNDFVIEVAQSNGCTSIDTVTVTVEDCTGLGDIEGQTFRVYPNPARDNAIIDLTGMQSPVQLIDVMSLDGALVRSIRPEGSLVNLDVTSFAAGAYIIRVNTDEQSSNILFTVGQ